MDDVNCNKHQAYFSSSPNGWIIGELGFGWLEGLFNEETKEQSQESLEARSFPHLRHVHTSGTLDGPGVEELPLLVSHTSATQSC